MYNKCCVDNCANKRQDVKMHQFPTSEIGLQKWLQCIGSVHLRSLSLQELRKMFVCHKHFEKRFITNTSRLRYDAYPTLFSESEIGSGFPAEVSENTVYVRSEHSYSRKRKHEDHTYFKSEDMDSAKPTSTRVVMPIENLAQMTVTDLAPEKPTSPCASFQIGNLEHMPATGSMQVDQVTSLPATSKPQESMPPYPAAARYSDGREVSSTLKNTAETVSFFDDLFDSTNGASLSNKNTKGKNLRKAVTQTSEHHAFWKEAIAKLEKMKFVAEKSGQITRVSVPSLKNWITTLKSLQRLWQFFSTKKIKVMRTRYFNSDPIENFFGQVRAYNFRNNDPDCYTFASTFRSLLITRFIKFHSDSYNCECDSGNQLIKIQNLFQNLDKIQETEVVNTNLADMETECVNIGTQARRERLHVHSRAYTAGWLVRKITQKVNCKNCLNDLTTEEGSIHTWISHREFNTVKQKKLTYPSEHAVRYFGDIIKESNEYLEKEPQINHLAKEIKKHVLSKYSFDFLHCPIHKVLVTDYFVTIAIRFAIFNWCNTLNRILKGTDIMRLEKNKLPYMQQKAYNKHKSKLKIKK